MPNSEREARREHAKQIGRIAYRLARASKIEGVNDIEGEDKHWRQYRRGFISIDLDEPFRASASETEFSRLRVSYAGVNVFEIRWDKTASFKVVKFQPGEWEGTLLAMSDRTAAS